MAGLTTGQAAGVAAFMGFLAGMLVILCVIGVVYYVLLVIAWWKLFTKAGEKGWKAIIPVYNFYVQCKLTWSPKFFWFILASALVSGIFEGLANQMTGAANFIFLLLAFALTV